MPKVITTPGKKGFLLWMKANQPVLYDAYAKRMNTRAGTMKGLRGLGDGTDPYNLAVADPVAATTAAPATSNWVDSIKSAFTGVAQIVLGGVQLNNQKKILDMQLQRAQQGLPPLNIDPATYGLQPTVGVGLSPQTKTFLTYGAIGLGGLWLLNMLMSRRKS